MPGVEGLWILSQFFAKTEAQALNFVWMEQSHAANTAVCLVSRKIGPEHVDACWSRFRSA